MNGQGQPYCRFVGIVSFMKHVKSKAAREQQLYSTRVLKALSLR